MPRFRIIHIAALVLLSLTALAEEKKCGPYEGVELTVDPELLEDILSAHKEWLALSHEERDEDDSRRANLCGANLTDAYLGTATLTEAKLGSANLTKADLLAANLVLANLSKAYLGSANLTGAKPNRWPGTVLNFCGP